MTKSVLILTAAASASLMMACGVAGGSDAAPKTGTTREAMVGGTVSGPDQDSVVFVQKGQDEGCSGTFIAPNLVLTARHCVADPDAVTTTECVGYGDTIDPSQMTIKTGADAGFTSGNVVGTGYKIYTPKTVNMCGYDIALIQLASDLPDVKISPMRFTAINPNEATIAVGYGVDQNNNTLPSRMQRQTTVLGVGPVTINYTENDGTVFTYAAPSGDVVTGESTCFGDSGGPLFDMSGNIVAMTSRGPFNAPSDGDHGNSCADMISVYAGARFNEQIIRDAATAAGHPLPADAAATTTAADAGTITPASTASGDDDDDDDTGSSSKHSSSSTSNDVGNTIPSSSCAMTAPGRRAGGAPVLLVGAALIFSRRRRSRRPR